MPRPVNFRRLWTSRAALAGDAGTIAMVFPHLMSVALRQGGVFTVEQARSAGCSDAEIRQCLRSGAWTSVRRGVYAEGRTASRLDEAGGHRLACAAAVLAYRRSDPVVSHESAAVMHDLPLLTETSALAAPSLTSDR